MKATDIIIAAILLIIFGSFLTGCQLSEKNDLKSPELSSEAGKTVKKPGIPKAHVQELVQKAAAVKKEVGLSITGQKEDSQVRVNVMLKNPSKKPVTSVQSWLTYDPGKLEGNSIDVKKTAFELTAPYANTFDEDQGLVMIGRANSDPITDEEIQVAEIVFDIEKDGTIMIDAYDYREDVTGHMSANTILDRTPYNILLKPDSPVLIVEN